MTAWTVDELDKIGTVYEIELAALRPDGGLRKPVTIWVVRVSDNLYVRSYRGQAGAWYRGALARREGRIWAGGVVKDIAFVDETDPSVNEQIDAAYRAKYRQSAQYVPPMVAPAARATTIKLVPRPTAR